MKVQVAQTHRGFVTQTDTYDVPDELAEQLSNLPEEDREAFVDEHGKPVGSVTEINEITETIDVEVTW